MHAFHQFSCGKVFLQISSCSKALATTAIRNVLEQVNAAPWLRDSSPCYQKLHVLVPEQCYADSSARNYLVTRILPGFWMGSAKQTVFQ